MRPLLRCLLFLFFLELFLRIGGQVSVFIQNYENQSHKKNPKAFRILCIGESLTYDGGKNSYPSQLEELLNQRKTERVFEVINLGTPATKTDTLLLRLKIKLEQYKPDMVIAMLGVNDTEMTSVFKKGWFETLKISFGDVRLLRTFHFLRGHFQSAFQGIINGSFYGLGAEGEKKASGKEELQHFVDIGEEATLEKYLNDARTYGAIPAKEEEILLEALKKYPSHPRTLVALALFYEKREDFPLMEKYCRMVLSQVRSSLKIPLLNLLAESLKQQKKYKEAGEIYFHLLKIADVHRDRDNKYQILNSLVELFLEKGDFEKAEFLFSKQLAVNPRKAGAYSAFVNHYSKMSKYRELEGILKPAVHRIQENSQEYLPLLMELGYVLLENKKYSEAEALFSRALAIGQDLLKKNEIFEEREEKFIGLVNQAKRGLNLSRNPREGDRLQKGDPEDYYLPATVYNYQEIKRIVLSEGLVFVAVQYPMWSVVPLKRLLGDDEKVLFVDNGPSFQNAVATKNYDEYFKDRFAGDFGHCTAKGYRLVAENIIKVISENSFHQQP